MDLHPYIYELVQQAEADPIIEKERYFVDCFTANWMGDFLHPYGDDLLDHTHLYDSLLYCYFSGQTTNFDWYRHSLYCGAYTIVFRELRCILEGMFIVFKIEKNNAGKTLEEKLAILKTGENTPGYFGKKVFETSGFSDWSKYYQAYKELSSYIHFSYSRTAPVIRQIKDGGFPESMDYTFDPQRFSDAVRIWREMAWLAVEMAQALAVKNGFSISATKEIFGE